MLSNNTFLETRIKRLLDGLIFVEKRTQRTRATDTSHQDSVQSHIMDLKDFKIAAMRAILDIGMEFILLHKTSLQVSVQSNLWFWRSPSFKEFQDRWHAWWPSCI